MVWEQAVVLIGKHEHLLMVVGSILGCDLTKVCSLLQEIQSRMLLPMVVMAGTGVTGVVYFGGFKIVYPNRSACVKEE